MHREYDFIVIGGGSAGYAAARTACCEGLSTLVIEGGPKVGGLCILRGCMPSKALIESANRNLTIRRAAEFGLRADSKGAVGAEIIARQHRYIGEFAEYRQQQLEENQFDFIRAQARFTSENELELTPLDGGEKRSVRGKYITVATGSQLPDMKVEGLEKTGYLSSDDILELADLPKTAIVLGGGAIAVEMAHYLDGVGTAVTLIQRSAHVLKDMGDDVGEVVEEAFRARGIQVYTETELVRASKTADGRAVLFKQKGELLRAEAEVILYALGRKPNTAGLGLEELGLKLEKGRLKTGATQQSSLPHIFAAGDVCGPHEVVHIAIQQGEIAARNAARLHRGGKEVEQLEKIDYRLQLFGVFCQPQAAVVGMLEEEAREQGLDVICAKYPFCDHGKSLVMGETEGFVKLVGRRDTGEIIGGSVVGPEACEIIHEIVVAMAFRATAQQLAAIPHYHPTLSEIWTYPAEEIAAAVEGN